MIEKNRYIETVKQYYSFLATEFYLSEVTEKVKGSAFYDVQYKGSSKIVSISYENIEDYLQVIIFLLQEGKLPDYDDKTKTLHLNKLNSAVLSLIDKDQIKSNNEHFLKCIPRDEIEKKLLKSAKELRLCLKYFNDVQLSV